MGNTKAVFLHSLVILKTEASLQSREECRQTQMLALAAAGCVRVLTDPVLVVSSTGTYELAGQIGPPDWDGVLGLHGFIC